MKSVLLAAALAATALMAPATDQLTGLPLYPGAGGAIAMPESHICKSTFQGAFYTLTGAKVDAVNAWLAGHLTGFRFRTHPRTGKNGSQDTFFNAAGTLEVTVTGEKDDSGDAYAIAYGRFQPGLSTAAAGTWGQEHMVCN